MSLFGNVNFFNVEKGFGFIVPIKKDNNLFFHVTQCEEEYEEPKEGDYVEFKIGKSRSGKPQAINVDLLEEDVYYVEKEEEKEEENKVKIILDTLSDDLCRLLAKDAKDLKSIPWRTMEMVIARAFEGMGFITHLTPESKDGGKDIILETTVNGKMKVYYVEVKHWKEKGVGRKYIDKFIQVNLSEKTSGGLFLATSGFTRETNGLLLEFSKQKVKLGEKEKIVHLCQKYVQAQDSVIKNGLAEVLFEETL